MSVDERIISLVAKAYGLEPRDILRKIRTSEIAEARQVVAYCLRLLNSLSFPVIGKILGGRDHTTIMHACKKIAEKIEKEKEFRIKTESILEQVRTIVPVDLGQDLEHAKTLSEAQDALEETEETPKELEEVIERSKSGLVIPSGNLELTVREKKILDDYRSGLTLQQIGELNKVTRERARQLVKKSFLKEAGLKTIEGFEIDAEEFLKGEKLAHASHRLALPRETKKRLLPDLITRAASYDSLSRFSHDVGLSVAGLVRDFPEVTAIIEQRAREKKERWSRSYVRCRGCSTTTTPHFKKGYCEKCSGIYKGKRRETLLKENQICAVCSIDRGAAVQKYGRDLYITKNGRVLCRGCFLQLTGGELAKSRLRRLESQSKLF